MLNIGLILPDVLGTYGDDGNALVIRQRARMRGLDAEIHTIKLGEPVPDSFDIYTLGGGEDTAQILAAEHLISDGGLTRAANKNTPIFAICAGLQVLGTSFRASGRMVDGVGLLDATTASLAQRTIGEVASEPVLEGLTETLTGFENHMGATILGADAAPLGRLIRGIGNADEASIRDFSGSKQQATKQHAAEQVAANDLATEQLTAERHAAEQHATEQLSAEGAVQGSIIATYMHGPALARNPQLADYLIARATGVALDELPPLNIPAVDRLRHERLSK